MAGEEAHGVPGVREDGLGDEDVEEEEALEEERLQVGGRAAGHAVPDVLEVVLLHQLQQREQAGHQASLWSEMWINIYCSTLVYFF